MKPLFTPGPWIDVLACGSVVKKSGTYPLPVDDDRHEGESWLEMRERTKPARKARDVEAEANKQIQIAAPDLYNALEVLATYAELKGIPTDAAQAALAKARGES